MWRWDQGRLLYFQYDVLKKISKVLIKFDNVDISTCESLFRESLELETGMPFAPAHYTVKRNYARVFQCSFLACFVGNKLVVTDICRDLSNDNGKIKCTDDYLFNHVSKFAFPFPGFDHYNATEPRTYPFCAMIKYLIAKQEKKEEAKLSLDDIFSYIIGNKCNGTEPLEWYKTLLPTKYEHTVTERRQLREMVIFMSQLSILKMYNGYLHLDILSAQTKSDLLHALSQSLYSSPESDRILEFFKMTSFNHKIVLPTLEVISSDPNDIEFIEGDKKRVEHFRVERSHLLRKFYRQKNQKPICCTCGMDTRETYPWTDYMLDIHHLLPLSSAMAISSRGTSLSDIVGLCPSCHRAIHAYYRKWLKSNNQNDFNSKNEAYEVYKQASKEIA